MRNWRSCQIRASRVLFAVLVETMIGYYAESEESKKTRTRLAVVKAWNGR